MKRILLLLLFTTLLFGCSQEALTSSDAKSISSESSSMSIPNMQSGTKQTAVNANVFTVMDDMVYTGWIVQDIGIFPVDLENGNIGEKIVGDTGWRITNYNGWLYYIPGNSSDPAEGEKGLNKARADGSGRVAIGPFLVNEFWMDKDVIYAIQEDGHICSFKTDGSELSIIYDGKVKDLFVYGDYIFYHNLNDSNSLYRIKTNGTENVKISANAVGSYYIIDDFIYYSDAKITKETKEIPAESGIYKISVNGGETTKIADAGGYSFTYYNGELYFINTSDSYKMYKLTISTNQLTKVLDISITDNYGYSNGWLWYGCEARGLYRCKQDGTGSERLFYDFDSKGNYVRGY